MVGMSMTRKALYALLTVTLLFSEALLAATIKDNTVININRFANRPSFQGNEFSLNDLQSLLPNNKHQINTSKQGISYFEVVSIGSSQLGWMNVAQSQKATELDHEGKQLLVVVFQFGKGHSAQASLNGQEKSTVHSEYICGHANTLHFCQVGEKITAWLHYFDFSGQEHGHLNVTSYSDSHPFYWSDSLYIQ
ncbi:DUF4879 domain-containing protein [uncultured Shewanella sp.]|uniref:DUF4879 domain-containing protein n=1 Tax=uncultured Shewanella sp. TaxID=173975 RepID=UPI0026317513|nr:DUF4879 domain-containing protein [uncultured Shewanella sp.]